MLVTDTKMANPDKPAGDEVYGERGKRSEGGVGRTWTNIPFGLKTGHARKAGHGDKVKKCLGHPEYDHWFGDDHLEERMVRGGARMNGRRVRCQ